MTWLYLSMTAALSLALVDALSKYTLRKNPEEVVAWARWGFASPFLCILLIFIPVPVLDTTFWMTSALCVPLDIAALLLYIRAIKVSPLSLVAPFLAFTPVFLIVTSFLLLGERPDRSGLAGIVLISLGAYLLNLNSMRDGILGPLRAIRRERGSSLAIVVSFIYSISSSAGKIAVLHSSPLFFASLYTIMMSVSLLPFAMLRRPGVMSLVRSEPVIFPAMGAVFALMVISHFSALRLVEVSYMISVKRTSLLFSVIIGRIIFKEKHAGSRFLGSAVMVAGVVLIALF